MLDESTYSNYKDFDGVKFPTRMVQKQGGFPILDLTVTDVKPNAAVNIQPPQRGAGGGGGAEPAVILIEADAYNPPPPFPVDREFASNLVENIERLKLDVDRILPIHGQVITRADLYKTAGRSSTTN